VDADIKSFFNHLDHEWIVKFIESRIKDPNIIRLVQRTLKAGIMEDFHFEPTEEGSGQGSVSSPIIANIYMHYVLVWWFHERVKPAMKGFCGLVVYADDFVACFQYKEDAERFYAALRSRLEHFGLNLQEEKSRLIEFGRFAEQNARKRGDKPDTFDFLGFTHYCSKSSKGWFRVKRKTSRKKFRKKLKEMNSLIKAKRHMPVSELIQWINRVLDGYYNYYAITDNIPKCSEFLYRISRMLFYWLNRRSQKKSYTWPQFNDMLKVYSLHTPKARFSIYIGKIAS
jgi:group II intron reverse transcriptase/maturase